jgi:hypothetical protein
MMASGRASTIIVAPESARSNGVLNASTTVIDALDEAVLAKLIEELRNTRNEQIFSALPPITDILGGRLTRLSSGGRECFHSISNIPRMPPWRASCPRLSRLTRFYDLLVGWKLDSFLLIRYRPRDPVCV